jgi:uncharacterized lipoprotein YmbA
MKTAHQITVLALVVLTGCFSLGRDEPVQIHYVLGGSGPAGNTAPDPLFDDLTIALRQLQIAEYLQTPFIVARRGQHMITFSESNRWGEGLREGITRTTAANLAVRAPLRGVDTVPWSTGARHDYLIQLHVLLFEGAAPEDSLSSDGEARVSVSWEIIGPRDGSVLSRGITDFREPWTVGEYGVLVALLDTGLGVLADDLVKAIEDLASP